jgi:hypothetical protein
MSVCPVVGQGYFGTNFQRSFSMVFWFWDVGGTIFAFFHWCLLHFLYDDIERSAPHCSPPKKVRCANAFNVFTTVVPSEGSVSTGVR